MQPQTIEDIRNYFIEHDLFNKYNLTKIGVPNYLVAASNLEAMFTFGLK